MKDNEVWDLDDLPPNGKTIGSKWLFKKKTDIDRAVHTDNARLVAKGFNQTPRIDYEESFSPVADIRAIRILIAIVAFYNYEIWQMDVKTAFLNGYLFEEVYMEQPEGFINLKFPNRVCKLKRSIYGLKKASRQWNKQFDYEIKKFSFTQNRDEPCVYMKVSGSYVTFLILYVDDILIMGNNIPMLQDVKSYLGRCFAMKYLGEAAYILGIKIYKDRSKQLIGLCQSSYIEKILKRYFMENSKRGSIPMQEKLKLSKSHGASTPAEVKRMQNVPYALVNAVKNILKYLRNTKNMFLVYGGDIKRELKVSCYTDAGYLTDADDLKSQTGYVFVLNGSAVDWNSTKQSIFATSSIEAEYIAVLDTSKEALKEFDLLKWDPTRDILQLGQQVVRIHDIDADEDITIVNDDNEIFDVDALAGEEVFVAEQSGNVFKEVVDVIDAASTIPISAATITDVEITLAQALADLKSAKPKADKVVIQEPKQGTTITTPTTIIPVPKPPHDKGKGVRDRLSHLGSFYK
ncbi:retrotransposon protein, putative, ty1-copia subclass [Tanacetum coccineum]